MNHSIVVMAWRPTALDIVTCKRESSESQRAIAWKFLKQNGVADKQEKAK